MFDKIRKLKRSNPVDIKNLLIVDDCEEVVHMVKRFLASKFDNIWGATSPSEATRILKGQKVSHLFEELLVEFSQKAIEKNTEALESYVSQAMSIAEAEGSSLMKGMVHLHLANAYLLVEKLKPALNNFRKATVEAQASRETNGLIAIEMEVQSLNGEGDVFFAMKNYAVAKEVYKEAARIAESAEQYLSVMDGWLMVTFCYELQERYIDAYRSCEYALLAGEKLSESERPKQGLAEVGDTLLRIINLFKINQSAAVSPDAFSKEHEIEARMIELIGTDWRKHLSGKG